MCTNVCFALALMLRHFFVCFLQEPYVDFFIRFLLIYFIFILGGWDVGAGEGVFLLLLILSQSFCRHVELISCIIAIMD